MSKMGLAWAIIRMDILKKYNEQQAESAPPGVQVHNNQDKPIVDSDTPKIIQWTIKYSGGLVKNERQADYALIGFVCAVFMIAVLIFFSAGNRAESVIPPPQQRGL